MYKNLANQNPIINKFNAYANNNYTPFQNNNLINKNVHVMNNLNEMVQRKNSKNIQNKKNNKHKNSSFNIIEQMLTPQTIIKDNIDIEENLQKKISQREENIKRTNIPYKIIIKDKIITHELNKDEFGDKIIVHKTTVDDSNIEKFNKELNNKFQEKKKINDELEIEFHIDNYSKHKKNFEYKETFIKNLAFEQNSFDESKHDYIEFYKQKQKEVEEGKKMCDEILRNIDNNNNIIKKEELPTENNNVNNLQIIIED